jgi:hypothetical protein
MHLLLLPSFSFQTSPNVPAKKHLESEGSEEPLVLAGRVSVLEHLLDVLLGVLSLGRLWDTRDVTR